jgi:hypothetical protein
MLPNLTTGRILGKLQANLRTKASSLFTAACRGSSSFNKAKTVYSTNPGYPSTTELHKATRFGEVFSPLFF